MELGRKLLTFFFAGMRCLLKSVGSLFLGLFAAGLLMPTLITWTMSGLDFAVRGRGTGIFQSLFALGQFASGLAVPFLARALAGGVLPAFAVLGGAAGLAGLAGLLLAARGRPGAGTAP